MKNQKNKAAAKHARKALKKQLKEKLTTQIEALVSEFGPDANKVKKVIEKASRNLAKILASKLSPAAVTPAFAVKDKPVPAIKEVKTAPLTPVAKTAAPKKTKTAEPSKTA